MPQLLNQCWSVIFFKKKKYRNFKIGDKTHFYDLEEKRMHFSVEFYPNRSFPTILIPFSEVLDLELQYM